MPEIIESDRVITPEGVAESRGDIIRIKAAAAIAGAALLIGVIFLGIALYLKDTELKAWATGLISLVVGTAIGFVFGGNSKS